MYDQLYTYFTEIFFFFQKQFAFTAGHSTGHVLLELIDQICECFDEKKYFIGIFIDLSKGCDTIDQKKLIAKLEKYGICCENLLWSKKDIFQTENNILYIQRFQ